MNDVNYFNKLYKNQKSFTMKFFDISAELDSEIEFNDIASVAVFGDRVEFMNFDGLWFITDNKNIYEIKEV
jgi:hypothetical protein